MSHLHLRYCPVTFWWPWTQHRQVWDHKSGVFILSTSASRAAVAMSLGSMVVGFTSARSAGRVLASVSA